MPSLNKAQEVEVKVGNLTKESIEKNRELLSEMKKEAKEQIYDI